MAREELLRMPIRESVLWLWENVTFVEYTEGINCGLTWVSGPFESEQYFPDSEVAPRQSTLQDFTKFVRVTFPELVVSHSIESA